MKTLEEIRKVFSKDRFATENGAVIDSVTDDTAVCSLTLCERHMNANGAVMGGVHYMLADFAFAVAVNHDSMSVVSLDASVSFVSAVKGTRLIAMAMCIRSGFRTVFYRVDVKDDLDNLCAVINITGYRTV